MLCFWCCKPASDEGAPAATAGPVPPASATTSHATSSLTVSRAPDFDRDLSIRAQRGSLLDRPVTNLDSSKKLGKTHFSPALSEQGNQSSMIIRSFVVGMIVSALVAVAATQAQDNRHLLVSKE